VSINSKPAISSGCKAAAPPDTQNGSNATGKLIKGLSKGLIFGKKLKTFLEAPRLRRRGAQRRLKTLAILSVLYLKLNLQRGFAAQNKKSTYLLLIRVYLLKCGIITSFNSFTFDTLYTARLRRLSGLV
jgi:hypothetical protein